MFSTAIKSLSSNISSHYSISQPALFQAGSWSVHDAKRRSTGRLVSVFTFDKRKLESVLSRSGGDSILRRDVEEIYTRLRREAGYLAKLRHPSVLELVEPVEESRSSISFVTERVTACLTTVIDRKASERAGPDDEVDEIEIQKGLLQLAKGLEFVHFSAGIVHINLVPDAVFVNAKSDWKLSGFGFAQDMEGDDVKEFYVPQHDQRLPSSLQFDLNYSAPELVIDHFVAPENDMFSIGCLIYAIYSSRPPLNTNQNPVTYKNTISQSLRITRDSRFPDYMYEVLPLLLTRRPTDRMSSRDFQDSKYFDNILINTIRFLDALPAKTATERHAFMRGLPRVLPQFPNPVQQKKILPTLLDELEKDESMAGAILASVLQIGKNMSQKEFSSRILPGLKKMKDVPSGQAVLVEQIDIVKSRVNGKEFKEDVLPLIYTALASQSPSIQERVLLAISRIAANLDFLTIKNELFPKVSAVFQQTSSLAVKVGALTALRGLIGGGLDKYTISEKLVPLLNGMKTREPTVIMCALEVYQLVVPIVEPTVLATDVLPHLWSMAVSPLLRIDQFRQFMTTIHTASDRIETEHGQKLAELDPERGGGRPVAGVPSTGDAEKDFEALVLGRPTGNGNGKKSGSVSNVARANRLAPKDTGEFEWSDSEPAVPPTPPKNNFVRQQSSRLLRPTVRMNPSQPALQPVPQRLSQSGSQPALQTTQSFSWQSRAQPASPAVQTSPGVLMPQRAPSIPESSEVWNNMRTTSVGSVGMASTPVTSSYMHTLQPQRMAATPVLKPQSQLETRPQSILTMNAAAAVSSASASANGFASALGAQDNPWQSVTSAAFSTNTLGPFGQSGVLSPPSVQANTSNSGFGMPQLVSQTATKPKQPNGIDKYASLL
ncbi:kinase-like domain-containing protein [Lipomyces arxii]|uniref:kinase-like domain-containing protein n=1 Tax=Lipomyces arxii TaxID=56418 RepID=UPI0034CE7A2A